VVFGQVGILDQHDVIEIRVFLEQTIFVVLRTEYEEWWSVH